MPDPGSSKAGRNEARKLTANAFNNIGVALVIASLLQPVSAYIQQDRAPTLAAMLASLMFLVMAGAMFSVARRKARELED